MIFEVHRASRKSDFPATIGWPDMNIHRDISAIMSAISLFDL